MQIGRKLFPYPTLNSDSKRSCFKDSKYSLECNTKNDNQYFTLEDVYVEINNENIKELIKKEQLGIGLIVECSATIYRKIFEISTMPQTIKIPIGDLRDKVEISCYIYAKKDIENFADIDFLEDYSDYKFKIEKNDIIAIDDGFSIKIDYDEIMDKKVSSIFQVIKNNSAKYKTIEKNVKKIVVSLPSEEFSYYENLSRNDNLQNIIFSMIAIPALTHCLKEIQTLIINGSYDFDDLELENNWVISVRNAYKKQNGKELTETIFKDEDVSKIAQELLNNGSLNGIKDLFSISMMSSLNGGEDDE